MTARLLGFPGLSSVFWPISTLLLFRWSALVLRFPTLPALLIKRSRIVSNAPITIGIIVIFMFPSFLVLWQGLSTFLSFRFLWFSLSGPGPVGWSDRIHRLHPCRGLRDPNVCPVAQSAGAAEYTDCISADRYPPLPPTSVQDMTQTI